MCLSLLRSATLQNFFKIYFLGMNIVLEQNAEAPIDFLPPYACLDGFKYPLASIFLKIKILGSYKLPPVDG